MRLTARRPQIALTAAALAATLGLAACGDEPESLVLVGVDVDPAADTSANDGVLLLNAGSSNRLILPVAYEVGDTATTAITIDFGIEVDELSERGGIVLEMTQTVTEVHDERATVEIVVDDARTTGNVAGDPEIERQLDELIGVPLVSDVSAGGTLAGEIRRVDGGEVPEFFAEQMAQVETAVDFPTEPVGVGAVWTSTSTIESNGITVEADTRYDLIAVTADEYVVEITQLIPVDERVDGQRIEGLIDATGRMTIDRDNPLDTDLSYDQSSVFEADGLEFSVELTMTMESD